VLTDGLPMVWSSSSQRNEATEGHDRRHGILQLRSWYMAERDA
jgi:hypothetical protein